MELIVFCGLQGAGKSSFYAAHFAQTHVRINLDMLRTRRREAAIFNACLSVGQRVVIDNTNVTRKERQRYLEPGLAAHFRPVAYYFDVPFETCAKRNAERLGRAKVPEKGLRAMQRQLQPPGFDEGFVDVFKIDTAGVAEQVMRTI